MGNNEVPGSGSEVSFVMAQRNLAHWSINIDELRRCAMKRGITGLDSDQDKGVLIGYTFRKFRNSLAVWVQ